jgi:hypothetical protein
MLWVPKSPTLSLPPKVRGVNLGSYFSVAQSGVSPNPNNYGKGVARRRPATIVKPNTRINTKTPTTNLPTSPLITCKQWTAFLARQWALLGLDLQAAWHDLASAATASGKGIHNWMGKTRYPNGFSYFMAVNRVGRQINQVLGQPIDTSKPVPWPNPPDTWDPPTITSFTYVLTSTYPYVTGNVTWEPDNSVWVTIYVSYPQQWPHHNATITIPWPS